MIALVSYQLTEFRRGRLWPAPVAGYLVFLAAFYLLVATDRPGSYGLGALGVLGLGVATGWTLSQDQPEALWQVAVVAAGSRQRAAVSRLVSTVLLTLPLVLVGALVTAGHRLAGHQPLPALLAGFLFYLVVSVAGAGLGVAGGSGRPSRASLGFGYLFALVGWLLALR